MFNGIRELFRTMLVPDIYGSKLYWNIRNKYEKSNYVLKKYYKFKWYRLMERYSACIPLETKIAQSCVFPHGISGIFISTGAVIGEKCVIFQQVTIGSNTLNNTKGYGTPTIGNNCYLGAGSKIIGNVKIGNNCRIGANCIVVENITSDSTVVMPKPIIIQKKTNDNRYFTYEKC